MLTQRFQQRRRARNFSGNSAPISATRGRKTSPPEIGAQFGPRVGGIEPATFRLQACVPPTRPRPGGQHGHTSSFATWPSPPAPARPKPKSKIQTPNGPFGFWSLHFAFWILEFGFWILDRFSLRFFCGGPKRPRLDFGFRILDFGLGLGSVPVTPTRVGGFCCCCSSVDSLCVAPYMFKPP